MIDLRNKAEHKEVLERLISDCEEITGFCNIDELHIAIHAFKTDYPDQKGYANFNEIYFFTDDNDLTLDFMYRMITGQSRLERTKKYFSNMRDANIRELSLKIFESQRISDFIKSGIKYLDKEHWNDWIDAVPVSVKDIYHGWDLECFLELHTELQSSTFEKCKIIFDGQGHSGGSAGKVFFLLRKFTPEAEKFISYLNKQVN